MNVEITFLVSASLLKCFLRCLANSSSKVAFLEGINSAGAGEFCRFPVPVSANRYLVAALTMLLILNRLYIYGTRVIIFDGSKSPKLDFVPISLLLLSHSQTWRGWEPGKLYKRPECEWMNQFGASPNNKPTRIKPGLWFKTNISCRRKYVNISTQCYTGQWT
mgnify:CR=1 FL=1